MRDSAQTATGTYLVNYGQLVLRLVVASIVTVTRQYPRIITSLTQLTQYVHNEITHKLGGERDPCDVPRHGRVVEIIVDIVVDAAGHALEEIGHTVAPAAGLAPEIARKNNLFIQSSATRRIDFNKSLNKINCHKLEDILSPGSVVKHLAMVHGLDKRSRGMHLAEQQCQDLSVFGSGPEVLKRLSSFSPKTSAGALQDSTKHSPPA